MDLTNKTPFLGIKPLRIYRCDPISYLRHQPCRKSHGFILRQDGITEYKNENKTVQLHAGEILYLKKGSTYTVQEIELGYSYIFNFHCEYASLDSLTLLPLPPGYDIRPLILRLMRAHMKGNLYSTLSLIYGLLEKSVLVSEPGNISQAERLYLMPVLHYLEDHLIDPELTINRLHELAGVSDTYLRDLFKKRFSVTPAKYIAQERVRLAKQLLTSSETVQIAEIAAQVGYSDPLYFSRLFKKHTGLSPTEYHNNFTDILF